MMCNLCALLEYLMEYGEGRYALQRNNVGPSLIISEKTIYISGAIIEKNPLWNIW